MQAFAFEELQRGDLSGIRLEIIYKDELIVKDQQIEIESHENNRFILKILVIEDPRKSVPVIFNVFNIRIPVMIRIKDISDRFVPSMSCFSR